MSSEKFFTTKKALITLVAASSVVIVALGIRQTFGLFFFDFNTDLDISISHFGFVVGLQLLSHAGDDDLKKLEAFRTLDPFDTHVSDTRFKLMAKALKRFSESSEFELGLEYSVKLLKCVAAVFSGGAKDSCVDMLAGIAKLLAKKFGKGSPSTYRVRIFASRCLNDTR